MRKYYINGREVTKQQWSDSYKSNPDATVVLRVEKLPEAYRPPAVTSVISPDRAKQIRSATKLPT